MPDMKQYNTSFRKIYDFMEKYLNATEYDELSDDMEQFTTRFELDMAMAVESEIRRVYEGRCNYEPETGQGVSMEPDTKLGSGCERKTAGTCE